VVYQGSVEKLAASRYMGGRTDGLDAMLTAASPQGLIDKMAVQRVMAIEMAAQMQNFRQANAQAVTIEAASATSAAQAAAASDEAAAVRAELQRKQSELQTQIVAVKARYAMLTPVQQAVLAAPPAALPGAPAPAVSPSSDIAALAALPAPGGGGGSGAGASAVQAALTRLGDPYVWGGSGPGAFDCSGLVMWSFQQAGVFLPHSSQALASGGQPVSMDQMQPGDVVTYYSDASHVGLYVGGGMMVHASTYGIPVAVVPVNNAPIYNVRRY
ncbi:MAG: NlpC/P60 family protein, partial [Mycobacterium sp.]